MRKPNPFTPFFGPKEWREEGNARLDNEVIDLVQMFSEAPWEDIVRIEVKNGSEWIQPYRDLYDHAGIPYPESGEGTMTREQLREEHDLSDAQLVKMVEDQIGVTIDLSGEDTPEKRFLRWNAYDRLIDDLTNEA